MGAGAFASAEILGEAGNRQIIGNVLDQDGNVMEEGVDFSKTFGETSPTSSGGQRLDKVILWTLGQSMPRIER